MSKKAKVWLVTALSLILIGALIFGGVMTMLGWDFKKLSTVSYETHEYMVGESYNNISIVTKTADIVLLPSADSQTTVVCYERENMTHRVAVEDDSLIIRHDTLKWYEHIGVDFNTPKITVYLPRSKYASLVISGSTGDIVIPKDFEFESMDISVTTGDVTNAASASGMVKIHANTGDISLENTQQGKLDLSVSTGAVTLSRVTCAGNIRINVSTGRTTVTDVTCESLTSNGDTGDIALNNTVASQTITIERTTGNVTLEKSDADSLAIKTDTGNVTGSLLTDKVFIAQSDTGRVDVPKTITGGQCEITTDTGRICFTITK